MRERQWTLDDIRSGIERFLKENGRYPTAMDFDKVVYLPAARTLQRSWGGVVQLRQQLGISETDYTKGDLRASRARTSWNRAKAYEEEFYNYLIEQFPERNVHEHKIIRPGSVCCDFYIYLDDQRDSRLVIDLFYAQDLLTLAKIVNIKLKRYAGLTNHRICFVSVGNSALSQSEIDSLMRNKKAELPKHIEVFEEKFFERTVLRGKSIDGVVV